MHKKLKYIIRTSLILAHSAQLTQSAQFYFSLSHFYYKSKSVKKKLQIFTPLKLKFLNYYLFI